MSVNTDDIKAKHPLSDDELEDDSAHSKTGSSITTKLQAPRAELPTGRGRGKGGAGKSGKGRGSGSEAKAEYRAKAQENRANMKKAGAKMECRGCRFKFTCEFFYVNDVYCMVCKRALERIKDRAALKGEEDMKLYRQALQDADMVSRMLSSYYVACGGMPKPKERAKKRRREVEHHFIQ